MKIEQIYTGCLAQGAYYITSEGEAAIIDPLREVQPYLDRAKKDGVKIKYVFETHFHADFVSGHLDLAKKTGATIIYGPTAAPGFNAHIAKDGEVFKLGKITLKVLHTPGHTMESSCYLLADEKGKDVALFSGDTLFLGDVGRPDLAQKAASMTQEELAGLLYESLNNKIMPLADDVVVYPAHGAGSACGKNMMKETVDTLGNQKKMNYALNQPDKKSFVAAVTEGLTPPPGYFGMNVAMNKGGYESFENVLEKGMKALGPDELEAAVEATGALVLDVRSAAEFYKGFIPRSVNIGLKGDFAPWVGALVVDVNQPIILVTTPGEEQEAVTRLARVGFDHVIGYLEGGFESWLKQGKETDKVQRITAEEFAAQLKQGKDTVVDVRKDSEYEAEHLQGAESRPLSEINTWFGEMNGKEHFYIHCAGGYRSMIAASILKQRGIHHFSEIEGGMKAITHTGLPKSDFVCQSRTAVK
jgi:glyoxylase-like metal-dependent hydrolase (beta-lactamase superfamily II)/rhodanese-related sulfurtransferase